VRSTLAFSNPTPYTLHLTPNTLYPTPYTLYPTPYTLHSAPYTLHPTPYTIHPLDVGGPQHIGLIERVHLVQEVEIESIRKILARVADTGHSHQHNVFGSTSSWICKVRGWRWLFGNTYHSLKCVGCRVHFEVRRV
jgi:hypothetical protein